MTAQLQPERGRESAPRRGSPSLSELFNCQLGLRKMVIKSTATPIRIAPSAGAMRTPGENRSGCGSPLRREADWKNRAALLGMISRTIPTMITAGPRKNPGIHIIIQCQTAFDTGARLRTPRLHLPQSRQIRSIPSPSLNPSHGWRYRRCLHRTLRLR